MSLSTVFIFLVMIFRYLISYLHCFGSLFAITYLTGVHKFTDKLRFEPLFFLFLMLMLFSVFFNKRLLFSVIHKRVSSNYFFDTMFSFLASNDKSLFTLLHERCSGTLFLCDVWSKASNTNFLSVTHGWGPGTCLFPSGSLKALRSVTPFDDASDTYLRLFTVS